MPTGTLNAPFTIDKARIIELIAALHRAHHDKNPEAIAAPFAPHAVIYDLEPPLAHDGISIERKRNWLATWASPIGLEMRDFKLTIDGDHAFGHGYLRMAGQKKGVERPISFWMRQTLCLERREGDWTIVHEHASVPFYMDESLRPAFDLKP
ncbi:MAG: YybH family protein [Terracidiphilus sp.]